jgi:hypothetical protein
MPSIVSITTPNYYIRKGWWNYYYTRSLPDYGLVTKWNSGTTQGWQIYDSSWAGTSYDPFLRLEYTVTDICPAATTCPTAVSTTSMPTGKKCNLMNDNVTVSKGETWIKWNWSYTDNLSRLISTDYDLFLNGKLHTQNYSYTSFLVDNIPGNSYQVLEVQAKNLTYNNITQCWHSPVKSDAGGVWWYLLIGLGLLVVGYFVPLFGFLAIIILLLGFGMVFEEYSQSFIVVTYGLSVIVAMIITGWRLGKR